MGIRTIEDDFEYQAVRIIQEMVDDYKDEDDKVNGVDLEDWLWENKDELGKYFYEKLDSYIGVSSIVQKIEF